MKHLLAFIAVVLACGTITAQTSPVKWQFSTGAHQNNQYTLVFTASIEKGWNLFAASMGDDDPNTRIQFDSASKAAITTGNTVESSNLQSGKNEALGMNVKYFENTAGLKLTVTVNRNTGSLGGVITYMAFKGDSIPSPESVPFKFTFGADGALAAAATGLQESAGNAQALKRASIDLDHPVNECGGTGAEKAKGLLYIFLLGMAGGLVGLIMPCTFPMIPLTVSFFTKRSGTKKQGIRNAFLYSFSIVLIYVLLSVPFYFLGVNHSDILNNISTNTWINLFFAAVFIVFALSFFGLFEILLPSGVANSVDAKSNVGSLSGIFFMALTLAIVSFSCTGPILGTLLLGALTQDGGAIQLTIAMAGFGLALGLPFGLFALFPNWLASLPKSGSWMNTIKIVFGFVELGFALKYFSNSDLVNHWGLLKREVFIGIWLIISVATALFLFGVIKFKHDPPPNKLGVTRISFGLLFFLVALYLAPGLSDTKYANLHMLSGLVPPLDYSVYKSSSANRGGTQDRLINDYAKALEIAKAQHKPVLIDFTGWACTNCRNMEEQVWPNQEVKSLIEKDYVLVSLYVDDRKQLPEDQQFLFPTKDGSKKMIKTIGDKYFTLQSENFNNASQPLYAIISPDEKLLNKPVGYTSDPHAYAAWLQCGLEAFNKSK